MFPSRLLTAFCKYQVITLVMRTYEWAADALYGDKVLLHKLTMDPFRAAKQIVAVPAGESSPKEPKVVATEMFHTTLWANAIAFMADYSVHQAILCYGYYKYYQTHVIKPRKERSGDSSDGQEGAILTSLLKKSTQLAISRCFAWVCSAAGGAVGTLWWPGWGTLVCSNMGEGIAGVLVEDGQPSATSGGGGSSESDTSSPE